MAYPDRLLTDDEQVLREFHPHWRVLLLPIAWAAVAIAAVVVAAALQDGTVVLVTAGVAALAWLAVGVPPLVRWYAVRYVLTTERIIVRTGILSREGTEIPLENINNVLFSQRLVERMLGYGDVLIESAGSQGQSRLRDIPDPEAFQSEVYRAREDRALALEGGGGPRDALAQLEALADLHERGVLTDEEFAEKKRRLLDQI
jgi:uncharacterized membrane protein YdbT with pleckstrin-like domain